MTGQTYRLWSRPLVASDNVIIVTADALVTAKVPLPQLPQVEARLASGEVPGGATVIPLAELREVIVSPSEPMAQLRHGHGTLLNLTEVFFENTQARDEVFTEMHRRLGTGWQLDDRDRSQATILGILLGLLVVVTAILYFGTRQAEAHTGNVTGFEPVAETVGSLGVLAIGGLVCLLCGAGVVWSVYWPPKSTTLSLRRVGGG